MGDQGNEGDPRHEIAPITQITETNIRNWLDQYRINNQLIDKRQPLAASTSEADDALRKARYQGEQRVLRDVLSTLGQRDAVMAIEMQPTGGSPSVQGS